MGGLIILFGFVVLSALLNKEKKINRNKTCMFFFFNLCNPFTTVELSIIKATHSNNERSKVFKLN